MRRTVFITHVAHEGPGLIGEVAAALGSEVCVVEAHAGEPLPANFGDEDVLVVMGGSMGVADIGDPRYPWLAPTSELLKQRLKRNAPNLGVCLGAQLLAHAAGARVAPMTTAHGERVREIGWAPVRLLDPDDPTTTGLPEEIEVLHWHGDGCDLPKGAKWLASSAICPVQMFRIGRSVGLQFHPEVDAAQACVWAEEDAEFVRVAHGPLGVERIRTDSPAAAARTAQVRYQWMRQIFEAITAKAQP